MTTDFFEANEADFLEREEIMASAEFNVGDEEREPDAFDHLGGGE